MTPFDPETRSGRSDSVLAFSIMFFAVALLSLLLGLADGVRRDSTYFHIPETRVGLIVAGSLALIGLCFLFWSRARKRS
jgi:hypothetical protein